MVTWEKSSGPLLDRIDIHVEVPAADFRELAAKRFNCIFFGGTCEKANCEFLFGVYNRDDCFTYPKTLVVNKRGTSVF